MLQFCNKICMFCAIILAPKRGAAIILAPERGAAIVLAPVWRPNVGLQFFWRLNRETVKLIQPKMIFFQESL